MAAEDTAYDNEKFARSIMVADGGEAVRVRIIPQLFDIEYQGADGRASARTVRIHTLTVSAKGAGLLQGFCFKRNAARSFRMDRVASVVDEYGEIHSPPAIFLRDLFDSYAVEEFRGDSEPPRKSRKPRKPRTPIAATRFINKHAADFVLLRLMAGVDGDIHELERMAITDHMAKLWLQEETRISSEHMEHVERWVDRLRPEQRDYAAAVEAVMAKPGKDIARVLLSMKAVLEADGEHDPREIELLDQLCIDIAS